MDMRNKVFPFILALMTTCPVAAQEPLFQFNHMDFGVTLGTTGLGFDVAMPANEWVRLRTGLSYTPKIEVPMTFGIQVGDDASTSQDHHGLSSLLLPHNLCPGILSSSPPSKVPDSKG